MIITFPICLLSAIAIKIDSEGSIFFKQERIGQNGKVFRILKSFDEKDAERDTGLSGHKKMIHELQVLADLFAKFALMKYHRCSMFSKVK
ncbi:MAG: sugar transferase [Ignavibacteriales bacterium]|nr:sugar transferase [Ignavibacteriales bacterium]